MESGCLINNRLYPYKNLLLVLQTVLRIFFFFFCGGGKDIMHDCIREITLCIATQF